MKLVKYIAVVLVLALFGCGNTTEKTTKTRTVTREKKVMPVDAVKEKYGDGLYAQINITEGDVLIRLAMDKAPLTVANFVALTEGNMPNDFRAAGVPYYDGLLFHRVINVANGDSYNFMIQGGDPDGNGSGGPGYQFRNETHPLLTHSGAGILAMANSGPNTNGSQFYITNDAQPSLDGSYNVFGKVVEGQGRVDRTLKGDKMYYVAIIRVGEKATNFDALTTFNTLK
ncbi:MAG: peptidyl-prolyl cis-trans isomerase A (cyclophilin A) [Bacteroidia bacterium]|jgi:peptidyl-prolyl cis-trans isomerase A (cyclophilin A)